MPHHTHCHHLLYVDITWNKVLIDFSLTVKAATLIFISGRGSSISSAKQGKSGPIYNFVKWLGRANVRAFHENPNRK